MGTLLELATLLILVLIAVELYSIKAELARLPFLLKRGEDKKDSPTINVNVGALPAQPSAEAGASVAESPAQLPVPEENAVEAEGATTATGEVEPMPEPEPPAPRPAQAYKPTGANATPSGILALKCPSCQAENSSYRNECFNCGSPLR